MYKLNTCLLRTQKLVLRRFGLDRFYCVISIFNSTLIITHVLHNNLLLQQYYYNHFTFLTLDAAPAISAAWYSNLPMVLSSSTSLCSHLNCFSSNSYCKISINFGQVDNFTIWSPKKYVQPSTFCIYDMMIHIFCIYDIITKFPLPGILSFVFFFE